MKKLLLVAISMLAVLSVARTGAAQSVSPEKAKLVEELIRALGSKEDLEKTVDDMMSMQQEFAVKAVEEMLDRDRSLSAGAKALAKEQIKSSTARIYQRVA